MLRDRKGKPGVEASKSEALHSVSKASYFAVLKLKIDNQKNSAAGIHTERSKRNSIFSHSISRIANWPPARRKGILRKSGPTS